MCTEDAFPDRRLQQLIAQQQRLRSGAPGDVMKINFGDHIFIEHVADVVSVCQPCSLGVRGRHQPGPAPLSPTAWPRCGLAEGAKAVW